MNGASQQNLHQGTISWLPKNVLAALCVSFFVFTSCVSIKNYQPFKKYDRATLEKDFDFMRGGLEKMHPALYWYTGKDSLDYFFTQYRSAIKDSMTEEEFGWQVVAPMVKKIRCGHTSLQLSKKWGKKFEDFRFATIPLYVRVWQRDSMAFVGHGNKRDSSLHRGDLIVSIDGLSTRQLVDSMLQYFSTDGYSEGINYIRLSSNFPLYHRKIFGIKKEYKVVYLDSVGKEKTVQLKLYDLAKDTTLKKPTDKKDQEKNKISRAERKRLQREGYRKLSIDTLKSTAIMELNTFSAGRLRKFFRQSFRTLKELQIKYLILDVRNNGGGEIDKCILLAKYIRNTPFKAVDTCTAVTKNFGTYGSGINLRFFTWLAMQVISSKKADGQIHCGSLERKLAEPKTTNHFNGQLYVLTSGPSFSATTLFLNYVKNEPNVKTIGEETSGGSYGNSGVMIPSFTMPNSKVRIRMPLFKIVNSENLLQKGSGFFPDYYVPPTLESIKKGIDLKMQKALSLIAATSQN